MKLQIILMFDTDTKELQCNVPPFVESQNMEPLVYKILCDAIAGYARHMAEKALAVESKSKILVPRPGASFDQNMFR